MATKMELNFNQNETTQMLDFTELLEVIPENK